MDTPQYFHHQCLCPHGEPQLPPASPGDTSWPAGRSGPGSWEVTAFALGSGACEILCALFKCGLSVSPSPVEVLQLSPTGLQREITWGFPLLMSDPQDGNLMWVSELSLLWEQFCDIIILQFVCHPPGEYWIWLYCECTLPTVLWFLMSLDVEYLFW